MHTHTVIRGKPSGRSKPAAVKRAVLQRVQECYGDAYAQDGSGLGVLD